MLDNYKIKEEDDDDETKENYDETKMKERKVIKNFKTEEKTSKKKKYRSKVREQLEENGIDYEEEL